MKRELGQTEEHKKAARVDIAIGRFGIFWEEYRDKNLKPDQDYRENLKNTVVETLNLQIMNPQVPVIVEGDPYFVKRVNLLVSWAQHPDMIPPTVITKRTRREVVAYTGDMFSRNYAPLTEDIMLSTADFRRSGRKFAGRPAEEG